VTLTNLSRASSTILALIDQNLKPSEKGERSYRLQGAAKIPAAAAMANPLDLLASLLEEIGVGRSSSKDGLSQVQWDSLSGRRVLSAPVQILMQSSSAQNILAIMLGQGADQKIHPIAHSQGSSWSNVTFALDQLDALYKTESMKSMRSLPKFQLTGALTLQIHEGSVLLLSEGMAWSSDRLNFDISRLKAQMQLPQNLMQSFELMGQIRSTDQQSGIGVTIQAEKIEDSSLELKIDYN
jgi:hypothetical protein